MNHFRGSFLSYCRSRSRSSCLHHSHAYLLSLQTMTSASQAESLASFFHSTKLYLSSLRKLPVLTLYTKEPCPLCGQALVDLQPFLDQVVLEKVDITAPENKKWWKAYRYDIPVFHLNGKFLMKHKADVNAFKKAVNECHNTGPFSS